jgi:hypothetical protein
VLDAEENDGDEKEHTFLNRIRSLSSSKQQIRRMPMSSLFEETFSQSKFKFISSNKCNENSGSLMQHAREFMKIQQTSYDTEALFIYRYLHRLDSFQCMLMIWSYCGDVNDGSTRQERRKHRLRCLVEKIII